MDVREIGCDCVNSFFWLRWGPVAGSWDEPSGSIKGGEYLD